MKPRDIKTVAIYLRKSRGTGDDEVDLEKHKTELVKMCEENGWEYIEYAEIVSGESIASRPKMKELLKEVENGTFDAVVCVAMDRLGRGNKMDQGIIEEAFSKSETLIITPQKVFDLNDDMDMQYVEFQGVMARIEYNQIKRRMVQGKRRSILMGRWSSGKPPFPYMCNPETKKLVPDESKVHIYRMLVEKALEGYTPEEIAFSMNKEGIPSPSGKMWGGTTIYRLLTDETHLGYIVANRRKVTSDGVRTQSRDNWTIIKNCHPAVKSELEHKKLTVMFHREKKVHPATRARKTIFSGLLTCGMCGRTMHTMKRSNRPNDSVKPCYKVIDPYGERCTNKGGSVNDVIETVIIQATSKEEKILKMIKDEKSGNKADDYLKLMESKLTEIKKQEEAIERIDEAFEDGVYSKDKYYTRLGKAQEKLDKLEEDYKMLKAEYDSILDMKDEDRLVKIRKLISDLQSEKKSNAELNLALKSCISEIIWTRESEDADPVILVSFL